MLQSSEPPKSTSYFLCLPPRQLYIAPGTAANLGGLDTWTGWTYCFSTRPLQPKAPAQLGAGACRERCTQRERVRPPQAQHVQPCLFFAVHFWTVGLTSLRLLFEIVKRLQISWTGQKGECLYLCQESGSRRGSSQMVNKYLLRIIPCGDFWKALGIWALEKKVICVSHKQHTHMYTQKGLFAFS